MVVTIAQPAGGQPFGPGFTAAASTSIVGPLPIGWQWHIDVLFPAGSETVIQSSVRPLSAGNQHQIVFEQDVVDGESFLPTVHPQLVGQDAQLRIRLQSSPTTVEDEGSVTVKWDYQSGTSVILGKRGSTTGGGGLTNEQAVQLEETHEATIRTMGASPSQISIPISGLIAHPPLGILRIDPAQIIADGDGIIDTGGGLFSNIFGLWWEILTQPPSVGFTLGLTDHYQVRVIQLRTIHSVTGIDVASEVLDADYQRVIWLWQEALPSRVEYSVTPGFVVALHAVRSAAVP